MVDIVEYKQVNSSESLASSAAYSVIHDQINEESEMGTLLGLTDPDIAPRTYRELHASKNPETLDRKMC